MLLLIILASVASSVSLILVNKTVMHTYKFTFVFTLTTFHFLCTWAALSAASRAGVFKPAHLPLQERLMVAAAGVGSIAFMNLSLQFNSVGTYQSLKLCCIPAVMAIQYFKFGVTTPQRLQMALLVLLVGVGLATVTDVTFNWSGTVFGVLAVLTTAQFQIWQGSKQKQFGISSVQLTHTLAPYQALITAFIACPVDVMGMGAQGSVTSHVFTARELVLIFTSGMIAVSVNLCSMGLIGRTSPITYQVVGHTKTCLVYIGGFVVFGAAVHMKNVLGICIAMSGVFWYSYLKMQK